MRRLAVLTAALVGLSVPVPGTAAPIWRGGGAPDGLTATRIIAEADGTLVAMISPEGITASIRGAPFRRQPSSGLQLGDFVVTFQAVAGGLRAVDDSGDVYASSDHGRTWHLQAEIGGIANAESAGDGAIALGIDSARPDRMLLAFADGGVQRSSDGGVSWFSARPVAAPPRPEDEFAFVPSSLTFAPDGSAYLQIDDRLWRSPDFGDTWTPLAAPPAGALTVDPVASDVLWVAGTGGVFRSDDGGLTWRRRRTAAVAVVPSAADPDVAWAIDRRDVHITIDGGASWRGLAHAPHTDGSGDVAAALPGRARSICIDDATTLWCSDGGAFAPDADRTAGAPASAFMVADPVAPGRAVAAQGRLIWETTDASVSWHRVAAPLDDYVDVVITRAGTFVSGLHGVRFAARGSTTWRSLAGPAGISALAADARGGTVYARTATSLWRLGGSGPFRRVAARGLHRGVPFFMSVGGGGRTIAVTGLESAVSTDGGAHFHRVRPSRQLPIVAASAFDGSTLVAGTARSLLRSSDAGRTWRRTRRGDASEPLADPWHRGRWYAISGRDQILLSTDDARSWRVLAPTPPVASRSELSACCLLSVARDRLWGTWVFGTGIWWRKIDARRR